MRKLKAVWYKEESEGVLKDYTTAELSRLILKSPKELPVIDFRCWRDGCFTLNPAFFHGVAVITGISSKGDISLDFEVTQAFDRNVTLPTEALKVVFSLAAKESGEVGYIQAAAFVPAVAHRNVVAYFNETDSNGYNSLIQFVNSTGVGADEQQNRAGGEELVEGTQERSESL